jgi:hypothetical protein
VIQVPLRAAVHVQPDGAVTATVPVPPLAVNACEPGDRTYVQEPACVTVTVRPATVSVPVRAAAPVFAAAV